MAYEHRLPRVSTSRQNVSFTPEGWRQVGATGEPAFQNSWVNYSAGYQTAAFYKDKSGRVHLRGLVKSGTDGTVIFTLPVGYRPEAISLHTTLSNNAVARVDITSTGNVHPNATYSDPNWISLDGISFRAST